MYSYTAQHGIFSLFFFLLILSPQPSAAQNFNQRDERIARFSPSMAIIVVVLIAALFFVGLFAIYIRTCSDNNAANRRGVRHVNGGAGRSMRGRGLDASVIESFPIMVYSEVKDHKLGKGVLECVVCLNEFEDHETLRLIPKCDHVFHPECINVWLASHTTCPVCRANLVPEPGDPMTQVTGSNNTAAEVDLEAQNDSNHSERRINNDGVNSDVEVAQVTSEVEEKNVNITLDRNSTRGSRSDRTRKLSFLRSHSTGHSLVQPGENTDRFTLRLPLDVRKQLMSRKLNRATSLVLPRERSSRRGYRANEDGGSSRGKLDRGAKSDRWVFSKAPSFLSRAFSIKSPKVAAQHGEGTSSLPVGPVADSSRSPV